MSQTTDTTYTISDLSQEFGISARTLRFYEDKHLLHPIRSGKKRLYQHSDYTQLRLILRGKRLGFSLHEIHEILSLYQPNNNAEQLHFLLHKIDHRKAVLKQQLQDIDALMSDLSLIEQQCIDSLHIHRTDKKTRLAMSPIWGREGRPL